MTSRARSTLRRALRRAARAAGDGAASLRSWRSLAAAEHAARAALRRT